ncbi:hypothetical protein BAUCODRAFT_121770 [Baudoinia panamericana UAMH 10762]|uniref:Uncharacterized protein n=1 Tax=Baudoinia panamericana (strain UAMH 10762) TaxID=717646 RepID=M2MKT8_BAUPA|nr:uncharacterized protein BAUCODRAFT_121770 [Baudoinia panamericana UAMH 10762]EMC97306.1 hypothetical protein BAUCODRAFT_121770 [Baudoinia panamericana UAMH 10762]
MAKYTNLFKLMMPDRAKIMRMFTHARVHDHSCEQAPARVAGLPPADRLGPHHIFEHARRHDANRDPDQSFRRVHGLSLRKEVVPKAIRTGSKSRSRTRSSPGPDACT